MSGVRSSAIESGAPASFLIFASTGSAGLKSATAAAISSTSQRGNSSRQASASWPAVSTSR